LRVPVEIVIIALLAMPVVACLWPSGAGISIGGLLQDDKKVARSSLSRYLNAVKSGDVSLAYRELCIDALRTDPPYSEQDHAAFLHEQPQIASFELGQARESSGMDGTYVSFPVHLTYADGTMTGFSLDVGMETEGAKVCDGPGYRSVARVTK
jgi:hypothetical protein